MTSRALLQQTDGTWLSFSNPLTVFTTNDVGEVLQILKNVEKEVNSGLYAAGFISYEAAPAFDRAYKVLSFPENQSHEDNTCPLIWFSIYDYAEPIQSLPAPAGYYSTGDWIPDIDETAYTRAVSNIKRYIKNGDTYQVNYTIRLNSVFEGDPYSLFHSLAMRQGGANLAFIETDEFSICSASPELFFELKGEIIRSRPMKGTASRGMTSQEDSEIKDALYVSEKNRAENVMIVDMIRNDLGRIAKRGSVDVISLFDIERYPTLFQMTSTVEAQTSVPVSEIIQNIFPCASITGAPKVHTMELISELESSPRGVYTGTIGQMLPNGDARFNVAIRTVVVDSSKNTAEYGVGGGIVWDSDDVSELNECLSKADVLKNEVVQFELIETLLWSQKKMNREMTGTGYYLKKRHLERLKDSAAYFGFKIDVCEIEDRLDREADNFSSEDRRVRLLLNRKGEVSIQSSFLKDSDIPDKLIIGIVPDSANTKDPFLYHKTTNRLRYEQARAKCPDCNDVLLVNEKGEVTESAIANLVIEKDGRKYTPPVICGLLGGTFRSELISKGEICERILSMQDLLDADKVFLINSVRGWISTTLREAGCTVD